VLPNAEIADLPVRGTQTGTQTGNSFLPVDYEVPNAKSNYMKLKEGINRFRILSSPIKKSGQYPDQAEVTRVLGYLRQKCGVPLEGVLYNLIAAKIFRVKPSDKDPGICNKCIDKPGN